MSLIKSSHSLLLFAADDDRRVLLRAARRSVLLFAFQLIYDRNCIHAVLRGNGQPPGDMLPLRGEHDVFQTAYPVPRTVRDDVRRDRETHVRTRFRSDEPAVSGGRPYVHTRKMSAELGELFLERAYRGVCDIAFERFVSLSSSLPHFDKALRGFFAAISERLQYVLTVGCERLFVSEPAHDDIFAAEDVLISPGHLEYEFVRERKGRKIAGYSALIARESFEARIGIFHRQAFGHLFIEQFAERHCGIGSQHDIIRFDGSAVRKRHGLGAATSAVYLHGFLAQMQFAAESEEPAFHALCHGERTAFGKVGIVAAEARRHIYERDGAVAFGKEAPEELSQERMTETRAQLAERQPIILNQQRQCRYHAHNAEPLVMFLPRYARESLYRFDGFYERRYLFFVVGRYAQHVAFELIDITAERKALAVEIAGIQTLAAVYTYAVAQRTEFLPHLIRFRIRVGAREPVDTVVYMITVPVPAGKIAARNEMPFAYYRMMSVFLRVYARGKPRYSPAYYENSCQYRYLGR